MNSGLEHAARQNGKCDCSLRRASAMLPARLAAFDRLGAPNRLVTPRPITLYISRKNLKLFRELPGGSEVMPQALAIAVGGQRFYLPLCKIGLDCRLPASRVLRP